MSKISVTNKGWRCNLCGYLHLGEAPPDFCPVCGATPDLFEPTTEATAVSESAPGRWRCINCDYLHDGATPPDRCLVCGVGPDQFEPLAESEPGAADHFRGSAIVVVGGGIAGLSAAEAARDSSPEAAVTLICKEGDLPYYRLNLTRYLAGEIGAGDLPIHGESWYAEKRITLLKGVEATAIDRETKTVSCKGHPPLAYDRLILAMGAHPVVPALAGANLKNVVTLRSCRDAETILGECREGASCAIVGGGVLGLEAAAALTRRRVRVTLLEGFDWLLPRQLNRAAGERIAREARALGITLILGARIKELEGDENVRCVILESGAVVPADLAIITAGVRSNSYLARMAGLEVSAGVVVDQHLRSSDPDIFAVGDLAQHLGTVYGTWAPSQFQGTIAGMNAAGGGAVFAGIPRSNSLKVLGTDLFSIGLVHPEDASYLVFEEDAEMYRQFIFRDSHLVGAILVGDTSLAPSLKRLIESNISCTELLAGVRDPGEIRARLEAMA